VKGSDYLGDQDAIEFMCFEAVQAVYELEHYGLPFSRTLDGRIAQRPFGGHTNNVTGKPVPRACYAADRTGHMILQTLYQQCIKNHVNFYDEYQVLDVLIENGAAAAVIALELLTGELPHFPLQVDHLCHRRARAHLGDHFQRLQLHRRRTGYRHAAWRPLRRYGVLPFHPTGITAWES